MHLSADAVAAVAIHDPEGAPVAGLGRTRALFDRMRNVRQPIAADHRGYSEHVIAVEIAERDVLWRHARRHRDRRIAVPALQYCAAIDGYQVPGRQYFRGGRDAMNNPVVDR